MLTVLFSSQVNPDIASLANSNVVIAVLRKGAGKSLSNFASISVLLILAVIIQL